MLERLAVDHLVNETAATLAPTHQAHAEGVVDDRCIEYNIAIKGSVAMLHCCGIERNRPTVAVQIGSVADDSQSAVHGARTEQRPLGPIQDFDVIYIDQTYAGCAVTAEIVLKSAQQRRFV